MTYIRTMTYNPRTEEAYQLLHDGILALVRAEQHGLHIDVPYIERKTKQITRKIDMLENEFKETKLFKHWQHTVKGPVNIHSGTQLGAFLYKIKKVSIEKETNSGQGATDDEALRQIAVSYDMPELTNLLQIRKLKKVRDTYLSAFAREQVNGYLHPFFNLHMVVTYRSSSDHPNFQNIPKRDEESMQICRRAILPHPGHQFLEIDYSGLEVKIAACYHKDSTMLKYINDPKSDMHADMAKQLFIIDDFNKDLPEHYVLRQAAKNGFVFPQFYGDYYKNCAVNMACGWGKLGQGVWKKGQGIPMPEGTLSDHLIDKGITSLKAFTSHVQKIEENFWNVRFAEYAAWKERWWNTYRKYGYIDMYTGFRCSGVMGKNDTINYPVQGAAFHCLLWSFIRLDKLMAKKGLESRLVGQIHDSILIDVAPNELERVAKMAHHVTCIDLPNNWEWINVPLEVDMELCQVDESWSEKKKYKFK